MVNQHTRSIPTLLSLYSLPHPFLPLAGPLPQVLTFTAVVLAGNTVYGSALETTAPTVDNVFGN